MPYSISYSHVIRHRILPRHTPYCLRSSTSGSDSLTLSQGFSKTRSSFSPRKSRSTTDEKSRIIRKLLLELATAVTAEHVMLRSAIVRTCQQTHAQQDNEKRRIGKKPASRRLGEHYSETACVNVPSRSRHRTERTATPAQNCAVVGVSYQGCTI